MPTKLVKLVTPFVQICSAYCSSWVSDVLIRLTHLQPQTLSFQPSACSMGTSAYRHRCGGLNQNLGNWVKGSQGTTRESVDSGVVCMTTLSYFIFRCVSLTTFFFACILRFFFSYCAINTVVRDCVSYDMIPCTPKRIVLLLLLR